MICCLSICNSAPNRQLNDPKEILVTSREKPTDITGNEGVSLTEFVFLRGLGRPWLNRPQQRFVFERRQKLSAETRTDFISPSVYVCSVAYMPTYWILQLSASVLQPAFLPADGLPRIYRHFLLSFNVSPPHRFYFTARFGSLSVCCCNMNPSPDLVKHHMFLIILI